MRFDRDGPLLALAESVGRRRRDLPQGEASSMGARGQARGSAVFPVVLPVRASTLTGVLFDVLGGVPTPPGSPSCWCNVCAGASAAAGLMELGRRCAICA